MATSPTATKKTVFRVRGLPNHVTTHAEVGSLVAELLGISPASNVIVSSLATSLDYWETPRSKVSTIQLKVDSPLIVNFSASQQWHVPIDETGSKSLILDTHFLGFTPLNDVSPSTHIIEYVASHVNSLLANIGKLHRNIRSRKSSVRIVAASWLRQRLHVDSRRGSCQHTRHPYNTVRL
jgi:hypothetical protein